MIRMTKDEIIKSIENYPNVFNNMFEWWNERFNLLIHAELECINAKRCCGQIAIYESNKRILTVSVGETVFDDENDYSLYSCSTNGGKTWQGELWTDDNIVGYVVKKILKYDRNGYVVGRRN